MKASSVRRFNTVTSLVTFGFVLVFGIVFLLFAIKMARQPIPENYVETEATITRIDEIPLPRFDSSEPQEYEYHVYIGYSYGGETYTDREYDSYSSSMKEGDTVLLYLDPADPAVFVGDPSGRFVFVIIGAAVVLIGAGGIGYFIYQKKKRSIA